MKIDRSKKPAAQGEIKFQLPALESFNLANGLRVIFVEKQNLPIIQFNLIVNAGSVVDPAELQGVANLTGLMLDEGANGMNALELDDAVESLGSLLEISTDHDTTFISMLCLEDKFEESLSLFSKVIKSPHLEEEDFKREKNRVQARILQLEDEPAYIANIKFEHAIFNNTNYKHPVIGYKNSVEKISLTDIKTHYEKFYNPQNSTLVVVGKIDEKSLKEKLNLVFADWQKENFQAVHNNPDWEPKPGIIIVDKKNASQSEIRIGLPVSDRKDSDYFARVILNSILGGQFSSRINLNLREDKGYTYGAQSAFTYNRLLGNFKTATSVDTKHTADAIKEILFEIKNIKKEIFEDEINFAKSYQIKKYPSLFETYTQIARNLNTYVVFELSENYFNNYISEISKITIQDLYRAAENTLEPENLTILVVGDKKELIPQLEKEFGAGIKIIDQ